MMAISSASVYTARSVTQTGNQLATEDRSSLGKEDFLQLLVTRMRYNDPMATDKGQDTDFIAQMAQFSSLEQMQNLNSTMAQMAKYQTIIQAAGLIGREVEVVSEGSSEVIKGKVEAVTFGDNGPVLQVNGNTYDMSEVIRLN